MKKAVTLIGAFCLLHGPLVAQNGVDEDQLGSWYMYFYQKKLAKSRFGIQGDFQYRAWNLRSDREQLLLRSGVTFRPKKDGVMFTLGYANVGTGTPGEADDVVTEHRTYQEVSLSQRLAGRLNFTHRFRYEQRFIPDQDFRTRFRYNVFLNVPLNGARMSKDAVYLALYNELFINGETGIGEGRTVRLFDRNRAYLGLGYVVGANSRVQVGWMKQTTANWAKGQLQFSLHQSF